MCTYVVKGISPTPCVSFYDQKPEPKKLAPSYTDEEKMCVRSKADPTDSIGTSGVYTAVLSIIVSI